MSVARTLLVALAVIGLTIAPVMAQEEATATPTPTSAWPNDIPCGRIESPLFHHHAHLAIYVNARPQTVPYGIGIGEPWDIVPSNRGPFVRSGSCFSWLHTHMTDGVMHIEAPIARTFTLGDFFAVWGEPLSTTQVGRFEGQVFAYVNGVRVEGSPADITLREWDVIQLNVGANAPPPQRYFFPNPCC
jgi:hypothetical protein